MKQKCGEIEKIDGKFEMNGENCGKIEKIDGKSKMNGEVWDWKVF